MIIHLLSASDGQVRYQVRCPQHNQSVSFVVSYTTVMSVRHLDAFIDAAAVEAIKTGCSECAQEVVNMPATRWPEGAEL